MGAKKITPDIDVKMLELRKRGKTFSEIGAEVGLCQKTVLTRFKVKLKSELPEGFRPKRQGPNTPKCTHERGLGCLQCPYTECICESTPTLDETKMMRDALKEPRKVRPWEWKYKGVDEPKKLPPAVADGEN